MNILVIESEQFSPLAVDYLEQNGGHVTIHRDALSEIPDILEDFEVVIVRFGLRWDASLIARGRKLRLLATPATGTDHIDLDAAAKCGITVLSLRGNPGLNDITATPEHAFGLLLSLARHTISAHQSVLQGEWDRDRFMGRQLKGLTVGVVGLGRTGRMFSEIAGAFGMHVCYYDPYVDDERYLRCASLEELAAAADVISLHAVLNEETETLVGEYFFRACKKDALLINTARGALIDEAELLKALETERIGGAALDVIRNEPENGKPMESSLTAFARNSDRLILTPHIGGATTESIYAAENLIAEEIVRQFVELSNEPT